MSVGLYVYAIAPADAAQGAFGTGIDRAPTFHVSMPSGPVAVVHAHEGGPYEGPDTDVQRWVLDHGAVVENVWDAYKTVLPVSFNVIVSATEAGEADASAPGVGAESAPASQTAAAEQRLREWLEQNRHTLGQRLDALRNRVELRIEIVLESASVAERHPEVAVAEQEMAQRPAGVQRLLRKRLQQRTQELTDALADELYPEYRRRLAAVAEDVVENRSARPERGDIAVISVSVLVREDEVSTVGSVLADIQNEQQAVRVRFLGPWPPYSFADLPDTLSPAPDVST